MSSSEGSVGDVEVAQGSQVSREGGLAIQVPVVLQASRLLHSHNSQTRNRLTVKPTPSFNAPVRLLFGTSARNHLEVKDRFFFMFGEART